MKKIVSLVLSLALCLSLLAVGTVQNAQGATVEGIDVSQWQGTVDFNAVKADGYDFVILRAWVYDEVDSTFETNYTKAKAAGLDVGVYIYVYGEFNDNNRIVTELEGALTVLKNKQFEYPIFIDYEETNTGSSNFTLLSKTRNNEILREGLELLENNGYYPGIYTFTSFAKSYLDLSAFPSYPLWIADFTGSNGYGECDMWQYTEQGTVSGVSEYVDKNYCYTDFPTIIKAAGKNGYTANQVYMAFDETQRNQYDAAKWTPRWYVTTGRSEVEYDLSQEFYPGESSISGASIYMKIGDTGTLNMKISTSVDGSNPIHEQSFNLDTNDYGKKSEYEGWWNFTFDKGVSVTKHQKYYMVIRITASRSYGLVYTNDSLTALGSAVPVRTWIREEGKSEFDRQNLNIGFKITAGTPVQTEPTVYPYQVDNNTLMVYNGNSLSQCTPHFETQLTLVKGQTENGLQMLCDTPKQTPASGMVHIALDNAADLSGYETLSFQLYLSRAFGADDDSEFEINFCTTKEDGYNKRFSLKGFSAGWHTLTVKRSEIDLVQDNDDSWNNITFIRLTWFNNSQVDSSATFIVDNIKAYNQPVDSAVANVLALINALPEPQDVTPSHKEAIAQARAAYNALNATQKTAVGQEALDKLEAAENALKLKGDITMDGTVDAKDALAALKHAVGKPTLSDDLVQLGDLNGDGVLDAKDALAMLKIAVG